MKFLLKALVTLALTGAFSIATPALAADAPKKAEPKDLVLKGDAKCTACHEEEDSPQQLAIGKTKHAVGADSRTPTCTSCHGESPTHITKPAGASERPGVEVNFGARSKSSAEAKNAACLSCHQKDSKRTHWDGSKHQTADVACSSCHKIHTQHDKVRDKKTQFEVCFTCHKEQRAQISRPSRHPILEGKVSCSDCHNVHGSLGPKLVKRDSTNETCYTCHMEKRGPFVRPHEPVNEDCGICHNPHGTTAEYLLKYRPPFLCHECHSPHGANSPTLTSQITPAATIGKSGQNYTQARGCANCHTQVHGSNNPDSTTTRPNPQYLLR